MQAVVAKTLAAKEQEAAALVAGVAAKYGLAADYGKAEDTIKAVWAEPPVGVTGVGACWAPLSQATRVLAAVSTSLPEASAVPVSTRPGLPWIAPSLPPAEPTFTRQLGSCGRQAAGVAAADGRW